MISQHFFVIQGLKRERTKRQNNLSFAEGVKRKGGVMLNLNCLEIGLLGSHAAPGCPLE
jgi:hypothetical protein